MLVRAKPVGCTAVLASALLCAAAGCESDVSHYHFYGANTDAGAGAPPRGVDGADASSPAPDALRAEGLPSVDLPANDFDLDVFGEVGARYWFIVSPAQVDRMNLLFEAGGFFPFGELYAPGGSFGEVATFADHLVVATSRDATHAANFGKVQVSLVGESTGRAWTLETLPNLKLDADEFVAGNRVGGLEHLRFNNGILGSIFREKLAFDLYTKLGYPAPRTNYAWVSSSVWGLDIAVPYVVVESYKPQFCEQRREQLGGGCANMWEFAGDFGSGGFERGDGCQFSSCDAARAQELELDVLQTPLGVGYKAALAGWLDWDAYHRFQCLAWIVGTADDAIHNGNNLVLVEREDGKFQHLPYSVDLSLGAENPSVSLAGGTRLALGCQSDPQCWADTIGWCEQLLAEFSAADPVGMLVRIRADLEAAGMLRIGDEDRYRALVSHLEGRLRELPVELELNRAAPFTGCLPPLVDCGGFCDSPEACGFCEPGAGPDAGVEGGAGDAGPLPQPGECVTAP